MCEMKKDVAPELDENYVLRANCFGLLMLIRENAEVLERIRELVDAHGSEYLKARLVGIGMNKTHAMDIGALNCVINAGNEEDRQRVYPSGSMLVH